MTAVPTKIAATALSPILIEKEFKLRSLMRKMARVLVAYSGGVDSSYLAFLANLELGNSAVCVLGVSPSVAQFQKESAVSFAKHYGFNLKLIETKELEVANYTANPTNRCYFCKQELYGKLAEIALSNHIDHLLDGTNADDLSDHRPGRSAAEEYGILSPLAKSGLSKEDIRELSRYHQLPSWEQPSSPCLSSRIAYGVPVTIRRLSKIENGEEFLRGLGLREFRLRVHGDIARIEISKDELDGVLNQKSFDAISRKIKSLGFRFVTLDMEGFRSGALNEVISDQNRI